MMKNAVALLALIAIPVAVGAGQQDNGIYQRRAPRKNQIFSSGTSDSMICFDWPTQVIGGVPQMIQIPCPKLQVEVPPCAGGDPTAGLHERVEALEKRVAELEKMGHFQPAMNQEVPAKWPPGLTAPAAVKP